VFLRFYSSVMFDSLYEIDVVPYESCENDVVESN
jgi:hypothetical protein